MFLDTPSCILEPAVKTVDPKDGTQFISVYCVFLVVIYMMKLQRPIRYEINKYALACAVEVSPSLAKLGFITSVYKMTADKGKIFFIKFWKFSL